MDNFKRTAPIHGMLQPSKSRNARKLYDLSRRVQLFDVNHHWQNLSRPNAGEAPSASCLEPRTSIISYRRNQGSASISVKAGPEAIFRLVAFHHNRFNLDVGQCVRNMTKFEKFQTDSWPLRIDQPNVADVWDRALRIDPSSIRKHSKM